MTDSAPDTLIEDLRQLKRQLAVADPRGLILEQAATALAAREQKLAVAQSMLDRAREREEAREQETRVLRDALTELAQCDLNESNCASLAVANARIRAIANTALAALSQLQKSDA